MASSTGIICSVCQKKGKISAANTWCLECSKSLCDKCKERHDSSNIYINHKSISVEEYQNFNSFVSNSTLQCDTHEKVYAKYCPAHQHLLCEKCINTRHKTCKDVMSLDEVTKNTKSYVVIDNMKTSIENIQLTIQNMKQNRNDNLTRVRTQIKDIQKKISQFRSQLNGALDNMEIELLKELQQVEKTTNNEMEILYKDINKHENKIEYIKRGIKGLEKYGTDLQTFIVGNQMQNVMHQEEEYLQSLLDKECFRNLIIKHYTNNNLKQFVKYNMKFGHFSIETISSGISVIGRSTRESQLPVQVPFSQLPVAQRFQVTTTKSGVCNLTAVCLLPNRDILFIGRNSKKRKHQNLIIVHDSDGLFKYSFPLNVSNTVDAVTSVDDRTVVINYDGNGGHAIKFVDICFEITNRTLQTNYNCIDIARFNDTLFYSVYGHGIYKLCLQNKSSKPFRYFNENKVSNIATYGDSICYTDTERDKVVLLNSVPQVLWKYQDKLLGSPSKLTFDKQGNIYVVGGSTYNVVFISHDGKQSRQVLSKEDGIMNTMSIDFDVHRNRLLVVSLLGDVVFYNCS